MANEDHARAIEAWRNHEIDSEALFCELRSHFEGMLQDLQIKARLTERTAKRLVINAFDAITAMRIRVPYWSCSALRRAVAKQIRREFPHVAARMSSYAAAPARCTNGRQRSDTPVDAPVPIDPPLRRHTVNPLKVWAATLEWRRDVRYVAPPQPFTWPRDEPDREWPELPVSASDLATLVGRVSAEDQSLVRLLCLRVLGGWSLREIAKRDNMPLDQIAEEWVHAKHLLGTRQASLGRIVKFDMLDLHVLTTLLRNPALKVSLNWRTFERILAAILERFGYEVELQRGTKDGGVDILALKRDGPFGSHRYLVQAKRWAGRVGVEPVRELLFLREHFNATKACLATTSTFTRGAWQLGKEYQWCLELRDFARLQDWIESAFPEAHLR